MGEELWRPWQNHDGASIPAVVGEYVRAEFESPEGEVYQDEGVIVYIEAWLWVNFGKIVAGLPCSRVLRYRLRRDPYVQQMIDAAKALDRVPA